VPARAGCHTDGVDRAELTGRLRGAVVNLWRPTGPPLPRLTRWAWTADIILAASMAVLTVSRALDRQAPPPVNVAPIPELPPFPPTPPFQGHLVPSPQTSGWLLILAALTALPLVTRRRYPLVSLWLVVVLGQAFHRHQGFDLTPTFISCVIAAYSATMYSRYRNLTLVSVLLAAAWLIGYPKDDGAALNPGFITFLLIAAIGLAANAMTNWKQRAQALEREQAAATQLAVDVERARLARELHDVVGHNVSVMVVQAGAARKVLDTAPEQAREALLAVEAGGRAAMSELRHVIGLLTIDSDGGPGTAADSTATADPAGTADLAPAPGLDQLPALAARVRDAGVPVELTVSGPAAELPAGVDLAAYRVVQEALTNAMKHAAGARVTVTVVRGPDQVRVEVTDTGGARTAGAGGAGIGPAAPGGGRGLIGLRERLAVYGGTLIAGPRPTGGYRLSAVLPIGGQS
jgi:signal transduction histidine kinase